MIDDGLPKSMKQKRNRMEIRKHKSENRKKEHNFVNKISKDQCLT